MRGNLSTLVLVFVLSVLALNACMPTTGAGDEVPTLAPTAAPVDVSDNEVCVDKNTGASLSYREAVEIAQESECLAEGQLKETRFCNEDTGTWWIDLDLDMPSCKPACVVDLNSKTAEINGRCMGVLPPKETEEVPPVPVQTPDEAIEIPGWMAYRNESHGYSFQYPPDCFYGPMAGYCKQSPPEERPLECLCFLNGEDPDRVLLQAFIGEKDNLALAELSVSHTSSPQYNPPPGTDVVQWLNENWSDRYQEIPGEPNADLSGIPAVRIYSPESPGVYSSEVIYFIHGDKLFQIQMLDVDNEDNRELYDQMLSTFEIAGGTPIGELPAVAWYGYVVSAAAGSQFDDYLVVLPEGTAKVSLSGADAEIEAEIVALRDKEAPGMHAHFWGTLACTAADLSGCELVVSRLRVEGPGSFFDPDPPEPVEGWEGVIYSGPPGLQVDDYFVLVGDLNIWYGIWGADPALNNQLEDLRDTGTVIRVWGQVVAGVMDGYGTQIQVSRFEVVENPSAALPPAPDWPEADDGREAYLNEDYGYQLRVPPTAMITESGPVGFRAEELPEGMTAEDYMAQLQELYGDQLCVQIEYALGYMTISAPPNEDIRYHPCGLTGLGAGEIVTKTEEVTIEGQTYTALGWEWVGDMAPCSPPRETLDCHSEMMRIQLQDGTRIEYGSRYEPTARFEDYLMKGRDMLLQIIASYETVPARLSGYSYVGWETYTSDKFGYSVKYPGGAAVMGGNLDDAVQFAGSAAGGEDWPVLTVDHPDTEFFHPPAGTYVHDWVIDFGYYYDEIGPEREIAGVPAVHLKTNASSMAYGYDEFFLIKGDQLFRILILHTDGQEDWDLYNAFLESLAFV